MNWRKHRNFFRHYGNGKSKAQKSSFTCKSSYYEQFSGDITVHVTVIFDGVIFQIWTIKRWYNWSCDCNFYDGTLGLFMRKHHSHDEKVSSAWWFIIMRQIITCLEINIRMPKSIMRQIIACSKIIMCHIWSCLRFLGKLQAQFGNLQ